MAWQVSLQGKMSRVLAAKCALSIRVDAMGDSPEPTIGIESRQMVRTLHRTQLPRSSSPALETHNYVVRARLIPCLSAWRRVRVVRSMQEPSTEPSGVTVTDFGFEGGPDRRLRLHLL